MEGGLRVRDRVVHAAVVCGGVALAKVVGLDLGEVATEPLPINLVEIVGLEDEGGDDALASRGLQDNLDAPEEEVPWRLDRGCIRLGVDNELGAICTKLQAGAIELSELC